MSQRPDEVQLPNIVSDLDDAQATLLALRRYEGRGGIPDADLTDEEWMAMISRSFAEDLYDPRQDIYHFTD
jgi:hypothetical protein